MVELNKVIQLMNDNPQLKILISGYTDTVGKPQDNQLLSNGRSLAVVNYLLASKQIPFELLISDRRPLTELAQTFEDMKNRQVIKVAMIPN